MPVPEYIMSIYCKKFETNVHFEICVEETTTCVAGLGQLGQSQDVCSFQVMLIIHRLQLW